MTGFNQEQLKKISDSFKAVNEVSNKRSTYHPFIKQIFEVAKENGILWLTAREVAEKLHEHGVIEHNNPRSIGDAMGNHKGGMGLVTRKVRGQTQYIMFAKQ